MSASRIALLIAAVALPIAVVLGSYAVTSGPRPPQVPTEVRVGVSAGPDPSPPSSGDPTTSAPTPPGGIPPPPPADDDGESDRDDKDDGDDRDGNERDDD
ncbi:hypothetical protein [Haloactinomyces albus]|uniref:Small secreted hydrophilic protein n=1 Tax=Haloactinomyces albus TaxID=1352928 RepID=A0AAE3ZF89_9ACTN|nr:hypothetical protein [Haloactinomyces albus]MDR7301934.1 hypothetical protein [Haloactinomyces albus]